MCICEYPDILIPDKNGGCIGAKKCISGKNNGNDVMKTQTFVKLVMKIISKMKIEDALIQKIVKYPI